EPFELPRIQTNLTGGFGVESGAAFDEFIRTGGDKKLTSRTRGGGVRNARLTPAIEFLQGQRVRAMVMRQVAAAVSKYDGYSAPFQNARGEPGRGGRGTDDPATAGRGRGRGAGGPPTAIGEHFQVANLCGYPAVAVPNGFLATGHPTSITFMGRLYNEGDVLALARAYEEAAGWHKRHPALG